jgi:hypothetical protein
MLIPQGNEDIMSETMSRRTTLKTGLLVGAAAMAGGSKKAQAAPAAADPMTPIPIPAQAPAKQGVASVGGTKLATGTRAATVFRRLLHPGPAARPFGFTSSRSL